MIRLPNLAVPELNGIGAQEIFVTSQRGCATSSAARDVDTARIRVQVELLVHHIMNCGFPLKVSGETDFPPSAAACVGLQAALRQQLGGGGRTRSSSRVGDRPGRRDAVTIDYARVCPGIFAGAAAVDGKTPGHVLDLAKAGKVTATAKVAFAS